MAVLNAEQLTKDIEQFSEDIQKAHRFVMGADTEWVMLGTPPTPTPSLRKLAHDIDLRESQAAKEAIATEGARVIEEAKAEAERAAAEADKILTLSVSAHESPNDNVAADYTPETGMLHLYVPRGPEGKMGMTGPAGAQGKPGERGQTGATGAQGVQGPPGPIGQAPVVDVLSCGGAAETQLTVISGGNAAAFQ